MKEANNNIPNVAKRVSAQRTEGESETEKAGCDKASMEVITLSAPYEWQLCKYELEWNQDN